MSFRYHKYPIIICIDFGTTSTGVSYSVGLFQSFNYFESFRYPDIIQVTNWPQQVANENKTPNINIYDRKSKLLHWGKAAQEHIESGSLEDGQTVKERFKSYLPSIPRKKACYKPDDARQEEYDNLKAMIDHFKNIFEHTIISIENNIGFSEKVSVEKKDVRFVITVPALWNEAQRSIMRNIAKEASFITDNDHENRLSIISESYVTALYCERKIGLDSLTLGDKYIICDAGGSTTAVAVFELTKLDGPSDNFNHCQLTTDSSDKCGSKFLDRKMLELLTRFCYNGEPPKDKEEEKARNKLFFSPIDKFIKEIKPVFGRRSRSFKFPRCKHPNILRDYTDRIPVEVNGEGDPDDGQCSICKLEDFKHLHKKNFGNPTIVKLEDAIIVPTLVFYLPDGVDCNVVGGTCTLTIPYDIMRRFVFNSVVRDIIRLIDRQIMKACGKISRTYLVGGLGCSPYLQKMIRREFFVRDTVFPKLNFNTGELVVDDSGEAAVMTGAMFYALEDNIKRPQTGVIHKKFECATTDEYNTLICLDIGYDTTSCSYQDLSNNSNKMIDITDWPGLEKNSVLIPTAKECIDGKTLWGAEVDQINNFDQNTLIFPSKLMASVKPNLRAYFCEYLILVLGHVYKTISDNNSHLSDKSKYRYVITMENCYRFFNTKSEMRKIAIRAGIVSEEDSVERLLLINRDNASAIYNEKKYFSETFDYIVHFLQVNVYHDACHLSLFEAVNIDSRDFDANSEKINLFRNVRCVKSATFDFDFTRRAISSLNKYLTVNFCIECDSGHITSGPSYYSDLRKGFLDCINSNLDLTEIDETQLIRITESGCCIAPVKVYDLLEYVFLPAIRDLVYEIDRFANQIDMVQYFKLKKIFLSGTLLQANEVNTRFLKDMFVRNISVAMNIPLDCFKLSTDNGKEALLGASLYGNSSTSFTERVSRRTYAVNVRAFTIKELEDKEIYKIEEEKTKGGLDIKNKIYNLESSFVLANLEEEVDLFPLYSPSTRGFNLEPGNRTYFIHRGEKVLEKAISKTFYALKECIVYATIYYSDSERLLEDESIVDFDTFQKIHQFEIYLKRDEDDPTATGDNPRLLFDVLYTPDNNKAIFEARIFSRLGKIPEFHFRDEFLVANIYDDEQRIVLGDLKINFES